MKIKEALVVVKRSGPQRISPVREKDHLKIVGGEDKNTRRYKEVLNLIQGELERHRIAADIIWRSGLDSCQRPPDSYDLIITLGGDGTLLRCSHFITSAPVLGVNYSPEDSIGMLCGSTAENFGDALEGLLNGGIKPTLIQRIQVTLKDKPLGPPALNEALFANRVPASTSRYVLAFKKRCEVQKSSGVWVSTAAGSTAVAMAAGARILPITSKKLQFVVRELYRFRSDSLMERGMVNPGENLEINSATHESAVFIDGQPTEYSVPFGESVFFKLSHKPLQLVGFNRESRAKISKK